MLRQRLQSGFALAFMGIAVVLLDMFLENGQYYYRWLGWQPRGLLLCLLIAMLVVIALREFYSLARAAGVHPFGLVGAILAAYLVLETCGRGWAGRVFPPQLVHVDFTAFVLAGGLAAAFLLQVARWGTKGAFANIGVTFLGVIYIGLLGSFLVRIRQMGWAPEDVYTPLQGVYYLVIFVFTIKMTDICAFFTGKYLGRRRLISSISPGKTVEGLIGGLVGGVITCVILFRITDTLNRPYLAVLLGIVLAGLGQLGDLAESIFKRDAKEKDSSDSVPGFGGLLDVVDSLLVAAPLAFLIFAVLPSR
ncbi:MAG: hypothetical protein GWP14_01765 [Actinobacteria bacterium]|nr:hypothetical protein [Actinomycetota bacterium]